MVADPSTQFLILPYMVWMICAFATAVYTNAYPQSVQRGAMPYCAANSGALYVLPHQLFSSS
jgi:hypothetical protein